MGSVDEEVWMEFFCVEVWLGKCGQQNMAWEE